MIRVASYNMRKAIGTDRRRRPERTLDVLSEINADVVALQEADRRFGDREGVIAPNLLENHGRWRALPLGMRTASMGWHGNAILVHREAQLLDCGRIHLPALEPRGAVMAELSLRGVEVRVVGMHLDLSGLWRRRQVHAILTHLAERARPMPTVMMGDLNDWTSGSATLRDLARRFHFAPTGPSFHARRPVARLDRIMVSPDLRVTACGVHSSPASRVASDHLPIWAEIDLA